MPDCTEIVPWRQGVNVDDREPLKQEKFLKNTKGKLCADREYIGQALFETLFVNGIQLVTKVNFMANPWAVLAAYCFFEKKPAIDIAFDNDRQLMLF